jgi:hypothetical protein
MIDRVVALTATEPPHEATHWTASALAAAVGISPSSVQRIWRAHKLRPHRVKTFKLSKDPEFVAKLRDIVGLYIDPPAHAVVLSVATKPTARSPGPRPNPAGAADKAGPGRDEMTHDYESNGTTTCYGARTARWAGDRRCMQRPPHQVSALPHTAVRRRRDGRAGLVQLHPRQ